MNNPKRKLDPEPEPGGSGYRHDGPSGPVSGSSSAQNPPPAVTSQGENNAPSLSKSPTTHVNIPSAPTPRLPPSPFHFGLHEVLAIPDDDSLVLKKPAKVAVPIPKKRRKASIPVGRKRRKSNVRKLSAAEYAQLSMKEQKEKEAQEELQKFNAAKERAQRRNTYGTHVHEKFIQLMQHRKRSSQVAPLPPEEPANPAGATNVKEDGQAVGNDNSGKRVEAARMVMKDGAWVKVTVPEQEENPPGPKKRRKVKRNIVSPEGYGVVAEVSAEGQSGPVDSKKSKSRQLGSNKSKSKSGSAKAKSTKRLDFPDSLPTSTYMQAQILKAQELLENGGEVAASSKKLIQKAEDGPKAPPKSPSKSRIPVPIQKVKSGTVIEAGPGPPRSHIPVPVNKTKPVPVRIPEDSKPKSATVSAAKITSSHKSVKAPPSLIIPTVVTAKPSSQLIANPSNVPITKPSSHERVGTATKTAKSAPEVIPRSALTWWNRITTKRVLELRTNAVPRRLNRDFNAKKKWKESLNKVKHVRNQEEQEKAKKQVEVEEESSSSSLFHEDEPAPAGPAPKKKGFFRKIIGFFSESDDSDTKREVIQAEQKQHKEHAKEEHQKLKKHKRKLRRKAKKQMNNLNPDNSAVTVFSRRTNLAHAQNQITDHQLGIVMKKAKPGAGANPGADRLDLTNIKNDASYRDFAKTAHEALPSHFVEPQTQSPTANLISSLVTILKLRAVGADRDTTGKATAAVQEFRAARRNSATSENLEEEPDYMKGLKNIRNIPGNISQKREVMNEIDAEKRRQRVALRLRVKYCCGDFYMKIRRFFREARRLAEIWHSSIHQVDGHFGLGPSMYFRWLRSVFILNLLYLAISCSLLVIPEVATQYHPNNNTFKFSNIFLAEGYIGKSRMFYGAYNFHRDPTSYMKSTGFRFILVIVILFILNSVFIGSRVRQFYHHTIAKVSVHDRSGEMDMFGKALCSWDFNIVNKDSALSQHRSIARDFTHIIEAKGENNPAVEAKAILHSVFSRSLGSYGSVILHWLLNLLLLVIVCGFGVLVYFFLNRRHIKKRLANNEGNFNSVMDVATASMFSFITAVFTPICVWATNSEVWRTGTKRTHFLIARVGLIYLAMFSVFYIFSLSRSKRSRIDKNCWEEEFGNELYRIILVEGASNFVCTLFLYKVWPLFVRKILRRELQNREFDVEVNQMNLLFLHTLSGVGVFYAPVLPALVLTRLFITFYWKKYILFSSCCFPSHQLEPKDVYSPYLAAFFTSYLLVTIMNVWVISEALPSSVCGPFHNYTSYIDVFRSRRSYNYLKSVLQFVTMPQFVLAGLCFGAGVVYTLRQWGQAYYDTMIVLHELLQLEKLDREFLLKAMYNIAKAKASEYEEEPEAQSLAYLPIEDGPKAYNYTGRRAAVEESRMQAGIRDFVQEQNRLAELLADDDPGLQGEAVVLEMEGGRHPHGMDKGMLLSEKALKRLKNKRLSVPASIFLISADAARKSNADMGRGTPHSKK